MIAPHLRTLLAVARRRWRLCLLAGLAVCAAGSAWVMLRPVTFQAQARLTMERGRRTVDFDANPLLQLNGQEYNLLNTQKDLLLSEVVLAEAISSSALRDNPVYRTASDPVRILRSRLEVVLPPTSWVITLGLRDEDPRRAEEALQALVNAFFAQQQRLQQDRTQRSLEFLRRQVAESRRAVDLARSEEEDYRQEHQLFATDAEKSFSTQRLTTLHGKLVVVKEQAASLKVLIDRIAAGEALPPAERRVSLLGLEAVNRHPLVAEVQKGLFELRARRDELANKYLERHPRMIEVEAQLQGRLRLIDEAVAAVVASIRAEHDKLVGQAAGLEQRIAEESVANTRYRSALAHLQTLASRTQSLSARYDLLLKRLNEEEVYSRTDQPQVLLADPPRAPSTPSEKRSLLLALSVLAGLGAGLVAGLLAEVVDRRVRWDPRNRRVAGLPLLARVRLAPPDAPPGTLDEDFRSLRTALLLRAAQGGAQVVAVISPAAGDGRSLVARELATAFVRAGERVLLVDGDLRQAGLTAVSGLPAAPGLNALLAGEPGVAPRECPLPGLWLMPSERMGEASGELVLSHCLGEWLAAVRGTFDRVVIDTPALEHGLDGVVLAHQADAVLAVVREGRTPQAAIAELVEQAAPLGGRVVGCVFNGIAAGSFPSAPAGGAAG